jgi:two-component system LytT family response regulator
MNVLIVEDEVAGQVLLKKMLERFLPEAKITGVVESVKDAVFKIHEHEPNLIFLDIQIKGGTGFDVLATFPKRSFEVIFVTAYDEFAISAIRMKAFDYLLKPLNNADFLKAIERLRRERSSLFELPAKGEVKTPDVPYLEKITVQDGKETKEIALSEVVMFHADAGKTIVFTVDNEYNFKLNLEELEKQCDPSKFFRSHQSYLIQVEKIQHLHRGKSGLAEMEGGYDAIVSTKAMPELIQRMGLEE